uniref:Uncharacterized protein n=1 Tax=Syphacia muris TaxID=451379 RepID=A0A0N5AQX1_9BILA
MKLTRKRCHRIVKILKDIPARLKPRPFRCFADSDQLSACFWRLPFSEARCPAFRRFLLFWLELFERQFKIF